MNSKNTKKLSLKKVTVLNLEEAARIVGASGTCDSYNNDCDYSDVICPITAPDSCEICQTVNDTTCYQQECTSY